MKPKEQHFGAEVKAEESMPKGTHRWKKAFGFYWVGSGKLYAVGPSQGHADWCVDKGQQWSKCGLSESVRVLMTAHGLVKHQLDVTLKTSFLDVVNIDI